MVNMNILATVALAGFAAAKTVEVKVAESGLTFTPNKISADVNDLVVFKFINGGHDVSSGPFNTPCKPTDTSLYSGTLAAGKDFSVNITNTDPIWIYCSVARHCSRGMTAVINAPASGNTIEAYTAAAANAGSGVAPPKVNNGSGGSSAPSPTTTGGATPSATPNAASGMTFSGAAAIVAMAGAWAALL